jgi:hypothetical protein
MNRFFPITIGIGAGIGLVFTQAIWGAEAIAWGLTGGAALGAVFGIIFPGKPTK